MKSPKRPNSNFQIFSIVLGVIGLLALEQYRSHTFKKTIETPNFQSEILREAQVMKTSTKSSAPSSLQSQTAPAIDRFPASDTIEAEEAEHRNAMIQEDITESYEGAEWVQHVE